MVQAIRRVVTGHDGAGKAVAIGDKIMDNVFQRENRPGVSLTNLWATAGAPADFNAAGDPAEGPLQLHPPERGTVFRIIEFEPEDPEVLAKLDGAAAFAEMGAGGAVVEKARHPFMHRTETVDYAIVLSGEIDMLLDDSDVHLKAGDVAIQRGTNHAWANRGTEVCRMAFILIDGKAG